MSSLRRCRCDSCEAPIEPGCRICGHDEIPLDDDLRCEDCRPQEDETVSMYRVRLEEERGARAALRLETLRRLERDLRSLNP